jgi:hypothetical protein
MSWTEIGRYNTSTPDGDVEAVVLEKDDQGNFRIKNDFGNNVFEFERMSAYELFRKIQREVSDDLEDDLNKDLYSFYDDDSEEPTVYDYDDCDYSD